MTKNWDELCDEEKSFDSWFLQNNKTYDDIVIDLLKRVYMQGYASGFQAKLKYSSDENLQK
jgi:hypothetical protein